MNDLKKQYKRQRKIQLKGWASNKPDMPLFFSRKIRRYELRHKARE